MELGCERARMREKEEAFMERDGVWHVTND